MKIDLIKQSLLNKIKQRETLKNCCVQKWASKDEKQHWKKGITEYDKEILCLCDITGENENELINQINPLNQ